MTAPVIVPAEDNNWMPAVAPDPLEVLRLSLPVSDPDRHALDTVADAAFARLAPGYPQAVVA